MSPKSKFTSHKFFNSFQNSLVGVILESHRSLNGALSTTPYQTAIPLGWYSNVASYAPLSEYRPSTH